MNRNVYLKNLRSIRDQIDRLMLDVGEIGRQGLEFISGGELAALKGKMEALLGKNDDVIAQAENLLSQPGNFGKKAPEIAKLFNESVNKFNEGIKEYEAKNPQSTLNGVDRFNQLNSKFEKQAVKVKDLSKRLFEKSKGDIKSCAIYAFGIGLVLITISQVIFQVLLKKNADVSKTESTMKSVANKIVSTKSISAFSTFIDGIRERFKTSMNPLILIPFFLGFLFMSAGLLGIIKPEALVAEVTEKLDKDALKMDAVEGVSFQLFTLILKSLRSVYTRVLFPIANALS